MSFQSASGVLLTVMKSPKSSRLLTPAIANNFSASACALAASALKKLVGCSTTCRSSMNFAAFGFGVGWISLTVKGIHPLHRIHAGPQVYRSTSAKPQDGKDFLNFLSE